ncbi:MBL fold metallo-hydrolase [Saccharopolyspora sp. NPDC050389]|uniref:MBL fold metallo-hydrolase n=1 Tax=Saccharopolyspora sp. NPDC050389 TaxID=3155516 RepID=UPI003400D394
MTLDLAPTWFVETKHQAGITRITEPYAHPLLRANTWHVQGSDRDAFIDAGLGIASLRNNFPHLFERSPLLLLTHAHLDHAGGAYEFDDIGVHESEADEVRRPGAASLYADALCEHLGTTLNVLGSRLPQVLLDAVPDEHFDIDSFHVRAATPTQALVETDIIDLGSRRLTVLELPGHSPGSLGFIDSESGALFTGDALYDGTLLDDLAHSSATDYRVTMTRLLSSEFAGAYPGHGPPVSPRKARTICRNYLARNQEESTTSERA